MNPAARCRALLAALTVALLAGPGCAVGTYLGDRGLDFTDIFDIKYGTCIGAGAKVELTHFVGVGGGFAALGVQREWYGRRSIKSKGFAFAHAGVIGVDGGYGSPNPDGWSDESADVYFLLINGTALADFMTAPGGDAQVDFDSPAWDSAEEREREAQGMTPDAKEAARNEPRWPPTPPLGTRWRIGFEVLIPGVDFGLYINFGELFDFLIGFTTIDIEDDDGIGKGELYELPPRSIARNEKVY